MAELLAPAGSLETVLTAIDAGADAVYFGGKSFNARKFAHNLADETMAQAVETAHSFGVKVYVTVNIVMADTELDELKGYLQKLDALQVDGIIVQDLAVAALARECAPNLPLHGSTQMTVSDLHGVRFLEKLGFTQVVLARELPLTEIRYICAHAKAAIEVFIHGASCMAYSGQCLMSSFIGARSGNRGACAQPCRLPYQLYDGEKAVSPSERYLLSLKDLNGAAYIDDLLDAGVASLKVEGRMKGAAYVRAVTRAYRLLIDGHYQAPRQRQATREEADRLLAESFNRTYQDDFLGGHISRHTVTEQTSGNLVPKAAGTDPGLTRRIPLYAHIDTTEAKQLRLTFWDEAGHTVQAVADYVVQKASHRPATQAWAEAQLSRLGDSLFSLVQATLWDETYMIPASVLNDLRRQCCHALQKQITQSYARPAAGNLAAAPLRDVPELTRPARLELTVRCDSLDGAEAAITNGASRVIYGGETYTHSFTLGADWERLAGLADAAGIPFWVATPRVFWPSQATAVLTEIKQAMAAGAAGVYAGSMGIFDLLQENHISLPVSADWSLNIFNHLSAGLYAGLGCQEVTLSPELMLRQIKDIVKHLSVPVEVLAEGRIEMMITEYCQAAALLSKEGKTHCGGACRKRNLSLKDRHDEHFPVVTDEFCRNHILNNRDLDMAPYVKELRQAGIARLRIEGRGRTPHWIAEQVRRYGRLCDGTETMLLTKEDRTVTRGHFFHGIL